MEQLSNLKMKNETNWYDYDEGLTFGTVGSDGGAITRDEEHKSGARMTLEEEGSSAPLTITCAIYGSMLHTRYFSEETEAEEEYEQMKSDLEEILKSMPSDAMDSDEEKFAEFAEEIAGFVEKYP